MGKMDRIIEIGAVKLVNGDVAEKFSSFVACPDRLSPEIINLTGIRDEDLVGAPPIDKVLPDFYKFCDGCFLVGHNVQFDYRFVRYYGEENRYMFDQKQYDTLTLAPGAAAGRAEQLQTEYHRGLLRICIQSSPRLRRRVDDGENFYRTHQTEKGASLIADKKDLSGKAGLSRRE